MTASDHLWALVLAGGDGTRLQPLTRLIAGAPIPKQYCPILGDRSLLETTLDRIAPLVPRARTLAIVNRAHLRLARPQLRSLPAGNVLVQPRNLETGPGLLLGLLDLARRDADATVVIFPSDHHVRDAHAFRRSVAAMTRVVDRHPGKLALLGAPPDAPDSGYGYIATGAPAAGTRRAFAVSGFHEKPAPGVAARLVRRGALWNTFVMAGRVGAILALLREVRPADVAALEPLPGSAEALAARYQRLAPWNFSHDVLARVPDRLVAVRADESGWSDWGTPEAIARTFAAMGIVPPWAAPLRAVG